MRPMEALERPTNLLSSDPMLPHGPYSLTLKGLRRALRASYRGQINGRYPLTGVTIHVRIKGYISPYWRDLYKERTRKLQVPAARSRGPWGLPIRVAHSRHRGSRMQMERAMTGRTNNTFEIDKAIAVLGYFVEQTGESMYSLMKLMYLADKLHLERYGRFIVGDTYCALKQGPVPSCTYNMMKHLRGEERNSAFAAAEAYFEYGEEHSVRLLRNVDMDELSSGEISCLSEISTVYQSLGKWGVRDLSHDPAWTKAWSSKKATKSVPIAMEAIASQLEDGELLIEHLGDRHPGEAPAPAARKRLIKHQA